MNCQEFESRWNDLLDERLPTAEDAALQAHAAGCAPCRELLVTEHRLWAELVHDRPAPRADFADIVLAESQRTLPRPVGAAVVWDARRLATVAAAIVAIAAVMLLLVSPLWNRPQPVAAVHTAGQPGTAVRPAPSTAKLPTDDAGWDDYHVLWEQFAVQIPGQLEYADEVAPGLTPWSSFFSYALGLIRRTFPEDHPSSPQRAGREGTSFIPGRGLWS